MIRCRRYVRSCLKRAFKLFPIIMLTAAVFTAALGAAFLVMVNGNNEAKVAVRLGMIGDTGAEYMGIGVKALEKLDSSRFAIKFIEYDDEQSVRDDLRKGVIDGYVYVPDEFIEDVLSGYNSPMTLVTADRTDDLAPALIREVSDSVSVYITESQRGIYGMQRSIKRYDVDVDRSDATGDLNVRYISLVTERGSWVNVIETGEMGTTSYGGYYLCSFLFLLLMLFSVMATPLFSADRVKNAYYRAYGVGSVKQLAGEFTAYAILALSLLLAICLMLGIVMPSGLIKEFSGVSLISMLAFFLRILPFALLIFSISVFLWELVPNTVNGVLLQFVVTIATGYISGCFYPSNMFPDGVRTFASLLPTGLALSGMHDAVSGESSVLKVGLALLIGTVFFAGSCALRRHRLQKGGRA